jgi:phosphoesterase RecJ-like protein
VASATRLLITSHINPDGDAIGSQLALYGALTQLGKQVTILNSSPLPEVYRFLPYASAIQHAAAISGEFDLAFVLDCSDLRRVGEWAVAGSAIVVSIDHHYQGIPFGNLNWCQEEACSTTELIYELIREWEVELDAAIATNIYAGILTDTGSFRFSNTTSRSLKLASRLVELGVNPQYVAEAVYESLPLSTLKLLGCGLETMELSGEGQIASLTVTQGMLQKNGAAAWETENFINFPKSIKGVRVALLFQQLEEGYYKVSLRSKGEVNVARIAKEFDGGGHYHAAGCRIRGSLAEVKAKVIELVYKYLS